MKATLSILMILLMCSVAQAGDFRKASWGMTRAQVKATEKGTPVYESDKSIAYERALMGKDFAAYYIFSQGKFVRAKYVCMEKFASENSYVDVYLQLVDALKKKYGKSDKARYFDNDHYKNNRNKWGLAIAAEQASFYDTWHTTDTEITGFISGKNYDINCGVEYISKKLEKLETDAAQKATQEQL